MPEDIKKPHNIFLYTLLTSCAVVILISFYSFFFQKNYDFIVETKCDNTTETCFYRDCSVDGNCQPNNLSYYKVYTLKARDFSKCTNEDCTDFCNQNNRICTQTECTDSDMTDGTCVVATPASDVSNTTN